MTTTEEQYRAAGIDPANPNPDGSDHHLMNAIDERAASAEVLTVEVGHNIKAMESAITDLIHSLGSQEPAPAVIGTKASEALMKCFEQTAIDVEKLAQAHVDHALAVQRDAMHFAECVRSTGFKFCRSIEEAAARGQQISLLMFSALEHYKASL